MSVCLIHVAAVIPILRRTLPDGSWTDAVVLNKDKDPHFREALAAWRAIVAGRYGSVLNMSAKDLWSLEVNQLLFRCAK